MHHTIYFGCAARSYLRAWYCGSAVLSKGTQCGFDLGVLKPFLVIEVQVETSVILQSNSLHRCCRDGLGVQQLWSLQKQDDVCRISWEG